MPWRFFRQLLNREELIQELAETKPIRTAARYAVYLLNRGKHIGYKGVDKFQNNEVKGNSFVEKFKRELQKEVKEMQDRNQKRH